ncbi:uncharacterized protein LOC114535046 isoform X2 [Dendronephthya gigantea]|uniref:uncharacterized protein LOC114535046 isoform X2 n=1 Tax=Dendronephthya gigantea TaxID=151771 RepID=UPI00106CF0FF|nr:uncharacterized protein LOC114535046 isoform X2 [Dendronephthya gigantea]
MQTSQRLYIFLVVACGFLIVWVSYFKTSETHSSSTSPTKNSTSYMNILSSFRGILDKGLKGNPTEPQAPVTTQDSAPFPSKKPTIFKAPSTTKKPSTTKAPESEDWMSSILLDKAAECPSVKKAENNKDSVSCRIPELDPFHPSIMQYIKETGKPYCPGTTYGSLWDGKLKFIDPNILSASYRPVLRNGDFSHKLGPAVEITSETYIPDDMIEVTFRFKNGQTKTDFFLQVATKSRNVETDSAKKPGMPLSILVLGIDSLSYGNTHRKLPEVVKFITENNGLFFTGHTVNGDGTTPQLTAMLTGKHVEEQYEARTGKSGAKPLDGWTWIFKQMKEYGYLTGITEDGIWDGPFQYRLMGFKDPPTDFYPRPFFLDIARRTRYPTDRCINNRNVPSIHWEYVSTVFNSYPKKLKFFVSFNAGYSHHEINNVKKNQGALMGVLNDLKAKGHLENTLVIVMGDHGLRFGKVRTQVQGKLEERLPLFSIILPPWFESKYPNVMRNLKINRGRLTSWFDVYATFRHVLSYPDLPTGITRGQSLFVEVPKNRTCKDAGTVEHWCPCLQWVTVDVNHPHIQKAGLAAIEYMNDLLSKDNSSANMCAQLSLKSINFAQLERPNEAVVKTHLSGAAVFKQSEEYFCRYQLQFQTSPSEGLFEATVKYHKRRFIVGTSISRINQYGDQPKCVAAKLPHVRKFCLCKDYKGPLG